MFKELLWASLSGQNNRPTSLIIAKHLGLMSDLIGGQQVEFQPYEDTEGSRLQCLKKIIKQIGLMGYLPDIYSKTIGTGEVLIWLRLTSGGYRIRYYHYDEFIPYFLPDSDDLSAAIIKYSIRTDKGIKSYRVLVDRTGYYTTEDPNPMGDSSQQLGSTGVWSNIDSSKYTFNYHPVPFFPLYLIRNRPTGPGSRALHDFVGLEEEIVANYQVYKTVTRNIKKFARQTILTNVPKELLIKKEENRIINLPSYRAGYRPIQPSEATEEEIAEYIGVDGMPGETFVQPINWDPVTSDQTQYLRTWSEAIYESLSSISKIGGNTAFETRAMIAIPIAAANRKANLIFTEGVCPMLADCLNYESYLLRCSDAKDRSVVWRRVELVEDSTRDRLDRSILTRNLSEQGVGDSELLKLQFPDRTEEDIKRITGGSGGIPYRKIDKTIPAVQSLLTLADTVLDPEVQMRLYALASSLVGSLEDSLNYGKYPGTQYTPGAGLPYPATDVDSPEPESQSLGVGGQSLGTDSLQGSVPGSISPTNRTNPLSDFFRSIWRRG